MCPLQPPCALNRTELQCLGAVTWCMIDLVKFLMGHTSTVELTALVSAIASCTTIYVRPTT